MDGYPRHSLRRPCCPIRASASSLNVQQVCCGSSHISEKQGAERLRQHRRLPALLPIPGAASGRRHSFPCNPPLRVQSQSEKELFGANTENRIPRCNAGFSLSNQATLLGRLHRAVLTVPLPVPPGTLGQFQDVPPSAGVDGVHHLSSTSQPTEDERLPALDFCTTSVYTASP